MLLDPLSPPDRRFATCSGQGPVEPWSRPDPSETSDCSHPLLTPPTQGAQGLRAQLFQGRCSGERRPADATPNSTLPIVFASHWVAGPERLTPASAAAASAAPACRVLRRRLDGSCRQLHAELAGLLGARLDRRSVQAPCNEEQNRRRHNESPENEKSRHPIAFQNHPSHFADEHHRDREYAARELPSPRNEQSQDGHAGQSVDSQNLGTLA